MPLGSAQFNLHQLMGSLRTAEETPAGVLTKESLPVWPFVTISRQAGSGGIRFGRLLADRLNHRHPSHEHPWHSLDRELVQRIASDHHLSTELIDSLEKSSHTWIEEFITGFSHTDHSPSELAVFRRVMQTTRALARAGHVILVGLAGVLMTRDMPGGLHVRIIAPFEWRVKNLAKNDGIAEADAHEKVKLLDKDRNSFVAKYWPRLKDHNEAFHLTLNASLLTEEQMADCVLPLIEVGVSRAATA
jgi:cytidylate kinase